MRAEPANSVPISGHAPRPTTVRQTRDSANPPGVVLQFLRSKTRWRRTQTAEPLTEIGRDAKKQIDIPTILVDRIVGHVAATKLKDFGKHGKPS